MNHAHEVHRVLRLADSLPELKSMTKDEFTLWLAEHYGIYRAFRKFAVEALASGRTHFSAYMIRERVRWYTTIEWRGEFKISNNCTPYLARLLIKDLPALEGVLAVKGPV